MSGSPHLRRGIVLVTLGLGSTHYPAYGLAEQVPGRLLLIRSGTLVKFISKPTVPPTLPLPGGAADPTVAGATFSIVDDGDNGRTFIVHLPSAQWRGLGNPSGARGFKYRGAPSDPCKVVILKSKVIKAVCREDQLLDPPLVGTPSVKLSLGGGALGYAAHFPVYRRNQSGLYLASSSAACTPSALCCGGRAFHAIATVDAPGDCGDIRDLDGSAAMIGGDLLCGGFYYGGGGTALALPVRFPGRQQSITAISSCTGQSATLAAATSVDTGSNRNCTAPGCLFGPPIPVPDTFDTVTSTCIVFQVSDPVSGTLDCGSGSLDLVLPVAATVYVTGDTATDPGHSIPGIQPCPICSSGSCIGGPNNGMACAPAVGDGTTHDCPPDPLYAASPVPLAFGLGTGTVSWTATEATNDTGLTPNPQTRVFSGYCRDADDTLCFAGETAGTCPAAAGPQKCWENGMAVGPSCAGTFETCEQHSNGAFGPAGGATTTITALGQPQDGILCGSSTSVLASLFSIAPTPVPFAAMALPGPGAVTIPVVGALCATASTCPLSGP